MSYQGITLPVGATFQAVLRKCIRSRTVGLPGKEKCGKRLGPFRLVRVDAHWYYTECGRHFDRNWWNFVQV